MMNRFVFVLPAVLLASSCGSIKPSVVKVITNDTAFIGETSDSFPGEGEFSVSSAKGVTCNGTFEFVKSVSGTGTISCSDKRSGAFAFIADSDEEATDKINVLKGYGEFKDGQRFTITFSKENSKERYYYPASKEDRPIYEGKPPAYDGQFEFDI